MSFNNRPRSSGRRAPNTTGYAAKLSHSIQITNQVALMNTMKGGQDVRNWALSARKELSLAGNAFLLIKKEPSEDVLKAHQKAGTTLPPKDEFQSCAVPKLAIVITSSLLREYFENKPEASKVKIANKRITATALSYLTEWVKSICSAPKIFDVICPQDDFSGALDIRVAAEALGMGQYVQHIAKGYSKAVCERVPTTTEAQIVLEHAIGEEDALLVALAGRLAHLYCVHDPQKFPQADQAAWDVALRRPEFKKLSDAMEKAYALHNEKSNNSEGQTAPQTEEQRIAEARKEKLARKAAKQAAKQAEKNEATRAASKKIAGGTRFGPHVLI